MSTLHEYPIHPNLHKIVLADGTIRVMEGYYGVYDILWGIISYNVYWNIFNP